MKRFLLIFALFALTLSAQEKESGGELNMGWKWANFAILVIGLGYLIGKNLPPVFRSRTEEIQKGIVEAQAMKRDAEKRAAEMDARLKALGDEIEKFKEQSRAEMQQESARITEQTRQQLEKVQRQTELEIETAGKMAQRELRGYAAKFALELAETRIRGLLDAKTEGVLIQDFVHDLEASKN
jgi:F0F1-type ATP synthase membrane subunit b/b'